MKEKGVDIERVLEFIKKGKKILMELNDNEIKGIREKVRRYGN